MPVVETVVSHQNWFQRMTSSIGGVFCGIFLVIAMIPLIWWNEQNAVCMDELIQKMEGNTHTYPDCVPSDDYADKIVHSTCDVDPTPEITDTDLLCSVEGTAYGKPDGFELIRTAEMYAWVEKKETQKNTQNTEGGGQTTTTTTTYRYSKMWTSAPPLTSTFNSAHSSASECNPNCNNPTDFSIFKVKKAQACSRNTAADQDISIWSAQGGLNNAFGTSFTVPGGLTLGTTANNRFVLTGSQMANMRGVTATSLTLPTVTRNAALLAAAGGTLNISAGTVNVRAQSNCFYTGAHPGTTVSIGDIRICYVKKHVTKVSFLGVQKKADSGTTGFKEEYSDELGFMCPTKSKAFYASGLTETSSAIYEVFREELKVTTWILRFLAFVLLFMGFSCITQPLSVAPDILPCIGHMVGDIVGQILYIFNCLGACSCFLFWTAFAWIFYRPLIGVPLCICACGSMAGMFAIAQKQRGGGGGQRRLGGGAKVQQAPVPMQMAQPAGGMQMAQPAGGVTAMAVPIQPQQQVGVVQPTQAQGSGGGLMSQMSSMASGAMTSMNSHNMNPSQMQMPSMGGQQQPQGQQPMVVTVPHGATPGMQMQIQGPKGPMVVAVPQGCQPGMQFQVMVPV